MRFVWLALGLITLSLGVVGAVLPLLPTVPFLLLTAFFFAKSSDRMHNWLINHNLFGKMIKDWHEHGSISRRSKFLATISILAAFLLSVFIGLKLFLLIVQAITLTFVLIFIWSRPEV